MKASLAALTVIALAASTGCQSLSCTQMAIPSPSGGEIGPGCGTDCEAGADCHTPLGKNFWEQSVTGGGSVGAGCTAATPLQGGLAPIIHVRSSSAGCATGCADATPPAGDCQGGCQTWGGNRMEAEMAGCHAGGCGPDGPPCEPMMARPRAGRMPRALAGCAGNTCDGRCGGRCAVAGYFREKARRTCANGICGRPAGPTQGAVMYPYYTLRGPRDFLMSNPPSIGP